MKWFLLFANAADGAVERLSPREKSIGLNSDAIEKMDPITKYEL
jgi:hypothetical protein